jgi:hypothetical protein
MGIMSQYQNGSMPRPMPPYMEVLLQDLVDKNSTKPFIKQLIKVLKNYLHISMPLLSDDTFASIFSNEFLLEYIKDIGLDIVDDARNLMQREDTYGMQLGTYPMTWPDAIAEALRNVSWLHHSCWMSPEQFGMTYPRDFFAKYAREMGFDRLGLNEP